MEIRKSIDICPNCHDCGTVCENHPDRPWGEFDHTGCDCGAGMPCPRCCVPPEPGESILLAFVPAKFRLDS